jgi:hypothetical protein
MTEREFIPWAKIPRMNRRIVVSEKIDGTNAAIVITNEGDFFCQSRTRIIEPGKTDNAGFALWAHANKDSLMADLGPGRHFGEFWGSGIQRGYGLPKGQKIFSLFNTSRWADYTDESGKTFLTENLSVVPVLYDGLFSQFEIETALGRLRNLGSIAAPGFPDPEGVVIFHDAGNALYKILIHGDEIPKGMMK